MSKKRVNKTSLADELMLTGTVTLTSPFRDGFDDMLKQIPQNIRYSVGAIGKNQTTGLFELRIDTIYD